VNGNFVDKKGRAQLPSLEQLAVFSGSDQISVIKLGFKRRVLYAPFKQRDLRVANSLYLQLAQPLNEGNSVEVRNPDQKLWRKELHFTADANPLRWSPVIHVNQTGYLTGFPKKAMVGYYLGNLGELSLAAIQQSGTAPAQPTAGEAVHPFCLLDARDGKQVFSGTLAPRPDKGFPFSCYQEVLEADFSSFKSPGEYRLFVPGLGMSFPFCLLALCRFLLPICK
jgi:hypothetical protein